MYVCMCGSSPLCWVFTVNWKIHCFYVSQSDILGLNDITEYITETENTFTAPHPGNIYLSTELPNSHTLLDVLVQKHHHWTIRRPIKGLVQKTGFVEGKIHLKKENDIYKYHTHISVQLSPLLCSTAGYQIY